MLRHEDLPRTLQGKNIHVLTMIAKGVVLYGSYAVTDANVGWMLHRVLNLGLAERIYIGFVPHYTLTPGGAEVLANAAD